MLPDGWPSRLSPREETGDKWLQNKFEDPENGTGLKLAQRFRVLKLTHYKEAKEKLRHEFVVAAIADSLPEEERPSLETRAPGDGLLYLRYERYCIVEVVEDQLPPKLATSSALLSLLSNQPGERVDRLTAMFPRAVRELNGSVKSGKTLELRHLTFPSATPSLLELAAVLEAHSTLSAEYRLRATMCYWFAGSTYEILEHLFDGQNENLPAAKKAGKLGPIIVYPGYRLMREREEAGGMKSLVDLVKSFELLGRDKKDEVPDAETDLGEIEQELRRIPTFDQLCRRSRERRDQAMAALEERERQKTAVADELQVRTGELQVRTEELQVRTGELQVRTDELQVRTGELQVRTDELQVTTDELQVTTDELQVTKDELQVRTDELELRTDELQVRTDELQVTMDELDVRTDELQVTTDELQVTKDELQAKDKELEEKQAQIRRLEEQLRALNTAGESSR